MKNSWRILFSGLVGLAFLAAVCAVGPNASHGATVAVLAAAQDSSQLQSVSGKIASVEKDSFTLTVSSTPRATNEAQSQQPPAPPAKTMTFVTDKNTTIEGTLKVGANAEVAYREENSKNLAVSVRITQ